MHDHLAVIQQHPLPFFLAFAPQGQPARSLFDLIFHRAGDGAHLNIG